MLTAFLCSRLLCSLCCHALLISIQSLLVSGLVYSCLSCTSRTPISSQKDGCRGVQSKGKCFDACMLTCSTYGAFSSGVARCHISPTILLISCSMQRAVRGAMTPLHCNPSITTAELVMQQSKCGGACERHRKKIHATLLSFVS